MREVSIPTFRNLFGPVVAACLVLSSAAGADTATTDGRKVADAWDRTYNGGDIDALAGLYAPDAQVIPKDAAVSGQDAIRTFFVGLKAKGFEDHRITVQSAREKGDVFVLSGRWEMSGPAEAGARKRFEGNWINVLERRADGWRTVLHTRN